MNFLTTEEAKNWCQARGLTVTPDRYLCYAPATQYCFTVGLEEKPSRVIALADHLVPTWKEFPFEGALLWIRERGIWGDYSEQTGITIVRQMRRAKGDIEPFEKRPGHIFEPEELIEMHSFLVIPMLFGWDAFLIPQNRDYFVFVSHDSILAAVSRTPEGSEELRRRVHSWNPREDKNWYPRLSGR